MSVRWTVRSEEVHRSTATWMGEKPRDGGKALLLEAFDFIHENKQPGRMIVDFGTGGSVSRLEYEQKESVPSPALVEETSNGHVVSS